MTTVATDCDGNNKKRRTVITAKKYKHSKCANLHIGIDDEDYKAISSVAQGEYVYYILRSRIREDDKECRVYRLRIPGRMSPRPEIFRQVDALDILDLDNAPDIVLRWVGRLKNLIEIHLLPDNYNSTDIPDDGIAWDLSKLRVFKTRSWGTSSIPSSSLGNFANLKELVICGPNVWSLPEEIEHLARLEILDLSFSNMESLPNFICNLATLKKLVLNHSTLVTLPDSLGTLSDLKELDLSYTSKLVDLPSSIGDLTNLEILRLNGSVITSLPAYISNLTNLKSLSLAFAVNLKSLLDGIGNSTHLECLNLQNDGIIAFPGPDGNDPTTLRLDSTRRMHSSSERCNNVGFLELYDCLKNLKNLKAVNLGGTILDNNYPYQEMLLILTSQLPRLGYIGESIKSDIKISNSLSLTLSLHRARARICYSKTKTIESYFPSLSLWPLILAKATSAFAEYPSSSWFVNDFRYYPDDSSSDDDRSPGNDSSSILKNPRHESSSIFRLLVEFGPTFLSPGSDLSSNP